MRQFMKKTQDKLYKKYSEAILLYVHLHPRPCSLKQWRWSCVHRDRRLNDLYVYCSSISKYSKCCCWQLQQMELANLVTHLDRALTHYLATTRHTDKTREIELAANDLNAVSRGEAFLDAALLILLCSDYEKEKHLLLSSLIKDRFKYDFETIPEQKVGEHYEQMCRIASMQSHSHRKIIKNICLGIAYIYIHLTTEQQLPLSNFLQPLLPQNPDRQVSTAYFTTLEYIASQLDNSRMVVDQQSRKMARKWAVKQQEAILQMLNDQGRALIQTNRIQSAILECFVGWIDLSYNAGILNSLPAHCLMDALFQLLLGNDEDLSLSCAECLKVIIRLIRNQQENAAIIAYLGVHLVPLLAHIERCISREDLDQAEIYLQLILAFTAKSLHIFTKNPTAHALEFLTRLAQLTRLTALQDFSCFDEFKQFWEKLLSEANRLAAASLPYSYQESNPQLGKILTQLYDSLVQLCTYPPEIIQKLQESPESVVADSCSQVERIRQRRDNCCELFDTIAVYLSQQYLQYACQRIRQLIEAEKQHFWGVLQAIIWSLVSPLRKVVALNENILLLTNTFGQVYECQASPKVVKRTFMKLFRGLMGVKGEQLFIKKLFYYVSTCFGDEIVGQQAQKTFCRGCELHGNIMVPSLPDFMQLLNNYLHRQHIVRGVFYIITTNAESVQGYLLQALLALRSGIEEKKLSEKMWSLRMTAMVEACKMLRQSQVVQQHREIVVEFVRRSMNFLKNQLVHGTTKQDENPAVQKAVKMVKQLMRSLQLDFWPFMTELYTFVMEAFRSQPICSYVYMVEVAITLFAKVPLCEQFLLALYNNFCQQAYLHISGDNYQNYTLLMDDFVGMNRSFFNSNAELVLKSGQLPLLIDNCIEFLNCTHSRVARATYCFFETIFMTYWPRHCIEDHNRDPQNIQFRLNTIDFSQYSQLKQQLRDKIHYILAKMLLHLSTVPQHSIRDCIVDCLKAQLKAFPQWNSQIWEQLIPPLPNDILVSRQKQQFMMLLQQSTDEDLYVSCHAHEHLDKMVHLIYKRMCTAAKRKQYQLQK